MSQGQTVQVDNFGTLAAGTTVANNGTIVLGGPLAVVTGGVSNAGLVRGTGRLAGGLANATNGTVRAGGGDYLTVNGAGPTNAGNIDLAGGTIEFTGVLTNHRPGSSPAAANSAPAPRRRAGPGW